MFGQVLQPVPAQGRGTRKPVHNFNLESRPFQIQPMLIAPVLAGETLSNLLLQSRIVVTHVSIRTSDTSSKLLNSPSQAYRTLLYRSSKG